MTTQTNEGYDKDSPLRDMFDVTDEECKELIQRLNIRVVPKTSENEPVYRELTHDTFFGTPLLIFRINHECGHEAPVGVYEPRIKTPAQFIRDSLLCELLTCDPCAWDQMDAKGT